MAIFPRKANPPLIVYADRMLPPTFPLQGFKPISGRHPQIIEATGVVEETQLAQCHSLNVCRQAAAAPALPDRCRFFVAKARDNVDL